MSSPNQLKNLRIAEEKISNNLFIVSVIVTIVTMAMVVTEFFTCGFFSVVRIEFFYLGVLLIYSLHKELVRWLGEDKIERRGEYFVYAWVILSTILFIINFLTRGRFSYFPNCYTYDVLKDVTLLTLEVLGVFIITRCLKILKIVLTKSKKGP